MPVDSQDQHLGVRECAGGPCHGSPLPLALPERVAQNEYVRWTREDRHAQAYKTLLTERSEAIVRNLGLQSPAAQAAECLGCHADHPAQRGPELRTEDGVGCEACHGGSERWLKTHTSPQQSHAQNIAQGLYPLDDPVREAELCLGCHFGSEHTPMRHRMLGAGHPRLRFELESYAATQPAHFIADEDYRERGKQVTDPVKLWAIGQAVAARELLRIVADPQRNGDGIWPEFGVLDCYTCHHSFGDERRPIVGDRGLQKAPGAPRLNDASLLMLRHILVAVAPELGGELQESLRALHGAITQKSGEREPAARRTLELVETSLQRLREWRASRAGVAAIALSLIDEGIASAYCDYPSAEQATAAIQSLAAELQRLEPSPPAVLGQINGQLARIFQLVQDGDRYPARSKEYVATLRDIRALLQPG